MVVCGVSLDNNDVENVFELSEEEEIVSFYKIKVLFEGV